RSRGPRAGAACDGIIGDLRSRRRSALYAAIASAGENRKASGSAFGHGVRTAWAVGPSAVAHRLPRDCVLYRRGEKIQIAAALSRSWVRIWTTPPGPHPAERLTPGHRPDLRRQVGQGGLGVLVRDRPDRRGLTGLRPPPPQPRDGLQPVVDPGR